MLKELESIENYNELIKDLEEYNPGHDDVQIEHFIVGSGVTDYGKYKQALAETHAHFIALQELYLQQKKLNAKIKILHAKNSELGESNVDKAQKELNDILIEEKYVGIHNLERSIARALHEMSKTYILAKKYKELIAGKDKNELILDYHKSRLAKLLAANTLWRGGNLSGVMETVTTLPEEAQKELLAEYHNLQIALRKDEMAYLEIAEKNK